MPDPRPLTAAEVAARLDALAAEVAELRGRLEGRRDPASTTAASTVLAGRAERPPGARRFGFAPVTAHTEGDTDG